MVQDTAQRRLDSLADGPCQRGNSTCIRSQRAQNDGLRRRVAARTEPCSSPEAVAGACVCTSYSPPALYMSTCRLPNAPPNQWPHRCSGPGRAVRPGRAPRSYEAAEQQARFWAPNPLARTCELLLWLPICISTSWLLLVRMLAPTCLLHAALDGTSIAASPTKPRRSLPRLKDQAEPETHESQLLCNTLSLSHQATRTL